MNKLILALALMVTFASCSTSAPEATALTEDSTAVVAVDTAACIIDSTAVETTTTK